MPYTIPMLPKVMRQLARFPMDWQDTLLDQIDALSLDPRPTAA